MPERKEPKPPRQERKKPKPAPAEIGDVLSSSRDNEAFHDDNPTTKETPKRQQRQNSTKERLSASK